MVVTNPALQEAAKTAFTAMRFSPYTENGVPVQARARITIQFRTTRPTGEENFESAQSYFEKGQRASFPAFGNIPYVLRAEFQVRTKKGKVETGQYTDTWLGKDKWHREATVAGSSCIRTQDREKYFRSSEGDDAGLLNLLMKLMEPIPAIDTFTESDWRIRRETVEGNNLIRVLRGEEDPQQSPNQTTSYWFDESGLLWKSYYKGLETRWLAFDYFEGILVAREIRVYTQNKLVMKVKVTQLAPTTGVPEAEFTLRKHEWKRAFTDEVR